MRLAQMFKMEFINADLRAINRDEALTELVNTTISDPKILCSSVIEILKQREDLGSTGIGFGVAIPHGKISGLHDIVVAFGRSIEGINYNAQDGKPVHLIFLLLAPEKSAGQHLKILAKISRMLKEVSFRKKLLKAKNQSDLYKIIMDQGNIPVS